MWKERLLVALLVGSLLPTSVAATASAGGDAPDSLEPPAIGPTTAAEAYGQEFRVAAAEAEKRLLQQNDIEAAFDTAAAEVGDDRLAGAWIEHTPTGVDGRVSIKGNEPLPQEVEEYLRKAGITVAYGAAFSRSELIEATNKAIQDASVAYASVDEKSNQLRIAFVPGTDLEERVPAIRVDIPFIATVAEEKPEPFAAMHGGQPMFRQSDNLKVCTSGFNVTKTPYLPGILTAGHCTISLKMNLVNLGFVAAATTANVDVQWHTVPSPHTTEGKYRCGINQVFCAVTSSGNPAQGSYICHYGAFSGFSCGNVISLSAAPSLCLPPSFSSPCNANFIMVQGSSLRGCPGDSGGPLFKSGKAHGIIAGGTGTSCTAGGKTVFYSKIGTIQSSLGVTIKNG